MTAPFIIYGLPRSRTFWLARFLSFGDWHCGHEQIRHVRGMDDVRSWLAQDCTGTAETAAALWWRLVQHIRPDIRTVVVRRPVADVVESLMALDMTGVCTFDRAALTAEMQRLDRYLDLIERHVPGVLSVQFDDLDDEAMCARVFEYCLPYQHDHGWWAALAPINLQVNMRALMRHYTANQRQLKRIASACVREVKALAWARRQAPDLAGMTIQEEPLDVWYRDGEDLIKEHCEIVGESRDHYYRKNIALGLKLEDIGAAIMITARCNGRMFGYIGGIISPSLESAETITATQTTFHASKDTWGLAIPLERKLIEVATARGAHELIFCAGPRGSGPKLNGLFRWLGAEPHGQLHRLSLRAA